MAARIRRLVHDAETRQRIQASNIITRLQNFIDGKIEMLPHQVTAALGLLKKSIPDLSSVEHSGEITKHYVIRAPALSIDKSEWQRDYVPRQTIQ